MNELVKIALSYFNCISNKNIKKLKQLLSEDIILQDWDLYLYNLNKVNEHNKKLFLSVDKIEIKIIDIYYDKMSTICEIEIIVDNINKINVVDILKFNNRKKISKITAYRR